MGRQAVMGQMYEDVVSGLVGMATSREEMLGGCISVGISMRVEKPTDDPKTWGIFESQLREADGNREVLDANEISAEAKARLGRVYRDSITDFRGTCVGYLTLMNGTIQLVLSPKVDKDGKKVDARTFDESRLVDVAASATSGIEKPLASTAPRGGHDQASSHY